MATIGIDIDSVGYESRLRPDPSVTVLDLVSALGRFLSLYRRETTFSESLFRQSLKTMATIFKQSFWHALRGHHTVQAHPVGCRFGDHAGWPNQLESTPKGIQFQSAVL